MAAYCTDADLLIDQNLPLPAGISKATFVQRAADEIDVKISKLYKTPVVFVPPDDVTYRATVLVLKQLNAHLATGRLILATDLSGEQNQLHAYGWSLIKEATSVLCKIADQEIILEGAEINDTPVSEIEKLPAHLYQGDPVSQVEAFYELVTSPTYNLG